jgi:predicted ATPase
MTIGPPLNINSLPGISTRLVGRDNELRLLRSGLDLVAQGRGVFFLLTGEPGIGKTRLAREVTSDAIGRGFVVESGRGWESTRAPRLWPWLKILRSQSFNDSPPTLYSSIERHAPEGAIDGFGKEGGLEQSCGARFDCAWLKLVENVAASFKKAASRTPLLLVVDDLQAADRCSLELLRFLSRELHDSPIMLIAISRDFEIKRSEFLREVFVDLDRNGIHLALGGLGSNAIAQLVEGATGAKADPGQVSFMIDATAGNPFLLLELLKLQSAKVNSAIDNSLWLPNALVAATSSRLDSLSARCQEMLRVASTIGRQFDLPVLQGTLRSETDELLNRLDEALDAHVLREAADVPGRYLFVHGIVRDVLYQQNDGSRRLCLHRRIAEVLQDIFADCLETHLGEIATHYFQGAERDSAQKALEYSERAAARANLLFEFGEAARFYAMAVTACDLSAQPESHRCDLLIEMAIARSRAGEEAQAQLIFHEAARMAERRRYPERIARAVVDQPEHCPAMLRLINRETVRLLTTAAQQLVHRPVNSL